MFNESALKSESNLKGAKRGLRVCVKCGVEDCDGAWGYIYGVGK